MTESSKTAGGEHGYATRLAQALMAKHFPEATDWQPLPDLMGVLTQIDNLTTALNRTPTPPSDESAREELALLLLNSDRAQAGYPAVASRDNIVRSEGYLVNADAILASPWLARERAAAAAEATERAAKFQCGDEVELTGREGEWSGTVIGHYATLAGKPGYVVENTSPGARGQVHVERERWLKLRATETTPSKGLPA